MIPIAGSAYTYSYATMGEFIAWIIGWDLVLEYAVGAATVAISWSRYLVKFLEYFGVALPPQLTASPADVMTLADGSTFNGIINLPALFIVVIISLLLMRGTSESAKVNNVIVVLKLAVVIVFIILGWGYIESGEPHALHHRKHNGQLWRIWLERHRSSGGHHLFCLHWL